MLVGTLPGLKGLGRAVARTILYTLHLCMDMRGEFLRGHEMEYCLATTESAGSKPVPCTTTLFASHTARQAQESWLQIFCLGLQSAMTSLPNNAALATPTCQAEHLSTPMVLEKRGGERLPLAVQNFVFDSW